VSGPSGLPQAPEPWLVVARRKTMGDLGHGKSNATPRSHSLSGHPRSVRHPSTGDDSLGLGTNLQQAVGPRWTLCDLPGQL
jgi:hypothetical protein